MRCLFILTVFPFVIGQNAKNMINNQSENVKLNLLAHKRPTTKIDGSMELVLEELSNDPFFYEPSRIRKKPALKVFSDFNRAIHNGESEGNWKYIDGVSENDGLLKTWKDSKNVAVNRTSTELAIDKENPIIILLPSRRLYTDVHSHSTATYAPRKYSRMVYPARTVGAAQGAPVRREENIPRQWASQGLQKQSVAVVPFNRAEGDFDQNRWPEPKQSNVNPPSTGQYFYPQQRQSPTPPQQQWNGFVTQQQWGDPSQQSWQYVPQPGANQQASQHLTRQPQQPVFLPKQPVFLPANYHEGNPSLAPSIDQQSNLFVKELPPNQNWTPHRQGQNWPKPSISSSFLQQPSPNNLPVNRFNGERFEKYNHITDINIPIPKKPLLTPSQKLGLCCRRRNLSSSCQVLCDYDTFTDRSLVTAVLTNQCPGPQLMQAFDCATSMADHTECCVQNGINTFNGGQCMVFCTTHQGNPSNPLQYIGCLQVFERIKQCYREYHTTHPNIFGDY